MPWIHLILFIDKGFDVLFHINLDHYTQEVLFIYKDTASYYRWTPFRHAEYGFSTWQNLEETFKHTMREVLEKFGTKRLIFVRLLWN